MKKITYKFSNSSTDFYFADGITHLKEIADPENTILIRMKMFLMPIAKRFKGGIRLY